MTVTTPSMRSRKHAKKEPGLYSGFSRYCEMVAQATTAHAEDKEDAVEDW